MTTKSKKSKKKQPSLIDKVNTGMKSDNFRLFSGLFLIVLSIYLLIAFVAFIFTGGIDHSKFNIDFFTFLWNSDITVQNCAGKLGAYFADIFINEGLGVSAVSIIVIMIVLGLKLLGLNWLSLKRTILNSIFISAWLSTFLAYVFVSSANDSYVLLGGEAGYFTSKWIVAVVGNVGIILVLILTLTTYLSITFDNFIPAIKSLFKRIEKPIKENTKTNSTEETVIVENTEKEKETVKPVEVAEEKEESFTFEKVIQEEEAPKEEVIEETPTEVVKIEDKPNVKGEEEEIERSFDISTNKGSSEADVDENFTVEQGVEEELYDKNNNTPLGDYDPTLDLSSYQFPPLDLLVDHHTGNRRVSDEELEANKDKIVNTLIDYKIKIKTISATVGPTITLYEIVPAPGVRISKIKNLEDDIALSLAALGIRIIAPIPGRGTIGIEVPNSVPEVVSMKTILSAKKYQTSKYELPVALGKTISNETFVIDLAKAPHMLVAGATGQGKSVGLNAIITSLLYKKHPSQLKFVLVDPKKVELNIYSKIERHFLAKMAGDDEEAILTDVQKVVNTLNSLTIEMDTRYDLLKKAHARNIKEYNNKFVKRQLNPENGHRFLPYIVVIIDEFADLIMTAGKEVEMPIARIAQLARAVGIHMIVATQRPSTNIITGVIKANFPTRVAFKVASMIDSRTILDSPGANQLIGRGDMLISQGSDLVRVQCAFVDTPEVEQINDFIGSQKGYASAFELPEYVGETSDNSPGDIDMSNRDSIFEDAAKVVVANQSGSTSLIQRRFSIGYNRAGRVIDQLEAAGIVGEFKGSKAREVKVQDEAELQRLLDML